MTTTLLKDLITCKSIAVRPLVSDLGTWRHRPRFRLDQSLCHRVSPSGFKDERVLLYTHPAALTPGCTQQACDFRDNLKGYTPHGLSAIGISPDSPE
jgi:peroxiredoxin